MTAKKKRRGGFDDPWAPEPRGSVPAAYTAAIAAAIVRCQHCGQPVGLAATECPAITCPACVRFAVSHLLTADNEPPF